MSKPHWIPFYANDFLASSKVALLTTEEVGAYVLLLCHAWQDPQCSLPDDDDALSILGRIKGDMTNVRACFVVKKHRLVNERLYHEWVKVKQKSDLAKKSIALRWKNERNTNVIRTQYSSQSELESQSELHKKEEKKPSRATVTDEQWLEELKKNVAYRHINFLVELGKMDAWFALPQNLNRQRTRRFILNWMNKIEAPMANGTTGQRPPPPPPKNDPIGRGHWKQVYGKPEDHGYV